MGRCIYGGIYDIDSPLSDEDGFRKDVIEALKELNSPVVRYPGGNFCATYHWQDGIGPRENRPKRYNRGSLYFTARALTDIALLGLSSHGSVSRATSSVRTNL